MGSIAMDESGDMALGFSRSSTSINPHIAWTGRLVSDPLGSMGQGESTIVSGGGAQTNNSHAPGNRWGDYSSMNIDPTDGCTFWYTNEYLTTNGTFNWHTRIGNFKVNGCQ